ncbi:hypothetical protein [Paenibacillus aestuarii]|uniref:DUF3221 domain-containing protein n=1 Tax=Paenibacillus aestuarii TaxID=516965 RepID=A0ABW0K119_9BACL|nr:hypothetical protein [Paenibacillus aestuarii]
MKFILATWMIIMVVISGCSSLKSHNIIEVQGITGYIISFDNKDNNVLVAEAHAKDKMVQSHLINIQNYTLITDADNNKIHFSDLQIGQKVKTAYYIDKDNQFAVGTKLKSQLLRGSKIAVQPEDFPDILPIDETKAIATALQSEKSVQLFVRNVDFNKEDKTWRILVDDIITMENKRLVKIDSKNGQYID